MLRTIDDSAFPLIRRSLILTCFVTIVVSHYDASLQLFGLVDAIGDPIVVSGANLQVILFCTVSYLWFRLQYAFATEKLIEDERWVQKVNKLFSETDGALKVIPDLPSKMEKFVKESQEIKFVKDGDIERLEKAFERQVPLHRAVAEKVNNACSRFEESYKLIELDRLNDDGYYDEARKLAIKEHVNSIEKVRQLIRSTPSDLSRITEFVSSFRSEMNQVNERVQLKVTTTALSISEICKKLEEVKNEYEFADGAKSLGVKRSKNSLFVFGLVLPTVLSFVALGMSIQPVLEFLVNTFLWAQDTLISAEPRHLPLDNEG
ncbi:MAG: hypothetical protein AB3N23_17305 [Paracoccaceae bacterium]